MGNLLLIPYFAGFFLFAVGLYSCGQTIEKNRLSVSQSIYSNFQISLRPLRFVIAIIIFSGICNAILILPAVIESVFYVSPQIALGLHQVVMAILASLAILIGVVGFFTVLCDCNFMPGKKNPSKLFKLYETLLINKIEAFELFFIALACSAYFYNTISSNSIIYDMGLYHLPFVKHLVKFGPEIGLANLHDRYAFYNIQLFGQAPIQAFSFNQAVVSPSLNILFLAAVMIFAYQAIAFSSSMLSAKLDEYINIDFIAPVRVRSISIVSYWFAIFVFGLNFSGSLFAYNADFSTSIVAGLVCFAFITGSFLNLEILLLMFLLPLLKLSGIVVILYVVLFATVFGCSSLMFNHSSLLSSIIGQFRTTFKSSWKLFAVIISGLYLVYLTTNIILSGYFIFPQYKTGPIGKHAVPYEHVVDTKDKWITGWARFMLPDSKSEVIANAPVNSWLPRFVKTKRGEKILFWIGSSSLISALSVFGATQKRNKLEPLILLSSATSIGIIGLVVLFALPPDPRFYSWINGLVVFNSIQLILLTPIQGVIAFMTLGIALSAVIPDRIAKVKSPQLVISKISKNKIFNYWRTRGTFSDAELIIRQPANGDQCWSAEPPCSAYRNKTFFKK